jgi:hypothetical protein
MDYLFKSHSEGFEGDSGDDVNKAEHYGYTEDEGRIL